MTLTPFYSSVRAFTLIEVLVTLAITTIGLVGLSAMMVEANRTVQDSGNRSQAVWVLEDLINRIKANKDAVGSYDTAGVAVNCNSVPQINCASYFNGTQQVNAQACSNAQLAAYDLWDVACSRQINITGSDVVRSDSTQTITNPELSVSVRSVGAVTQKTMVTIELSWDSRIGGSDSAGNRIYIADSKLTANTITTRRESISADFTP